MYGLEYDQMNEVVRLGLKQYQQLLSQLEPIQNGWAIAIHVDTGEYAIADTLPDARREMYERYPQPKGRILSRIIGPETSETSLLRALATGQK
jgi:hypothetical protein